MDCRKIKEAGNREAVYMNNGKIRVVIDANKGMIPELSTQYKKGWINSHWQPWFRANSPEPWNGTKHSSFWKIPLLYDISGNFPCAPNFGPDNVVNEYNIPPHGFTAFEQWDQGDPYKSEKSITFTSTLKEGLHPFRYKKTDLLLKNHSILYTRLDIQNTGKNNEPYNCGWHNTVGPPFLESACLIDNNAQKYSVPAAGTEFDNTGHLKFGAETDSLKEVPLREGGTIDIRKVPGINGYTDFICGAVPPECELGWASIINPRLKLIYLSFFKGPAVVKKDEIPLYFYDLWMNYGGRPYTPWAAVDGLTDQTFCLGSENVTGYYANGLNEAIKHPKLLGYPTYLDLKPSEKKSLYYGTLFQEYEGDIFDDGIFSVKGEIDCLALESYSGIKMNIPCDFHFASLRNDD
ncbi:hypothetical protein EXM22_10290 [Oceanispirochaeta crateris]|uniref:DUF4432 family protein n=1 Tax=Oceanispirochaeta crateris TaxID=2518645 RepID=A0A5C1QLK5_9SPIO|nr:hypothetical protein [Oceanispirochaeta crateris]QEN08357.1 hypothetical protein EXM22_10290 [Oceanispirochaeta crateris]